MEKCGYLSCVPVTAKEQQQLLVVLRNGSNSSVYDFLSLFLDKDLLRFLDVFSGEKMRIVSRSELLKIIQHVKIYNYFKARGVNEESLKTASATFHRRKHYLRKVYGQLCELLEEKECYEEK
jgi:hypothetical protein